MNDLRVPIGSFFALVGAILCVTGLAANYQAPLESDERQSLLRHFDADFRSRDAVAGAPKIALVAVRFRTGSVSSVFANSASENWAA